MKLLPAIFIFLTLNITSQTCHKKISQENPLSCSERFVTLRSHTQDYILPFQPGKKYVLSQTCCNPDGGHRNQLAYDFAMYSGDTVCCMRSGTVKKIRENQPDNGGDIKSSDHNYVMIEHEDGTVAFYAHLMHNGVFVDIGDRVEQGEYIALSGNSGNTLNFPHLHIGLYERYPPVETFDLPVIFKNIEGPVDENGQLIADTWYSALGY